MPDRLEDRIRQRIQLADFGHEGYCWEVTGGRKSRNGYARVYVEGREVALHRVVYEQLVGPIPPKMILDHLCRNRACCNPQHLEPVTHRENTLRGRAILFRRYK